MKNKSDSIIVVLTTIVSLVITIIFFYRIINRGFVLSTENIDFAATGQIGDYFGGIVGTIFTGVSFYLLYLNLKDQKQNNEKNFFESKFFEIIRLHKENIEEMSYSKFENSTKETAFRRKVFKIIINEFKECLREVRHFSNSKDPNEYFHAKYRVKLETYINEKELKVSLIEFATIEIAYNILYFGLKDEGKMILKNKFIGKYSDEYLNHLLNYMELKPKGEFINQFLLWENLQRKKFNDFKSILRLIYNQDKPKKREELYGFEKKLFENKNVSRYYGGHEHRLSHFFRNLKQSYIYLYDQNLDTKEILFYSNTLRAQLSISEQYLIFVHSITSLGHDWEIKTRNTNNSIALITDFNIIKDIHGSHFYGIYFENYYPKIEYLK